MSGCICGFGVNNINNERVPITDHFLQNRGNAKLMEAQAGQWPWEQRPFLAPWFFKGPPPRSSPCFSPLGKKNGRLRAGKSPGKLSLRCPVTSMGQQKPSQVWPRASSQESHPMVETPPVAHGRICALVTCPSWLTERPLESRPRKLKPQRCARGVLGLL